MEEWEKHKKFTIYNNPMLFGPFNARNENVDRVLSKFLPTRWQKLIASQRKNAILDFVNLINDYYYFKGMPLRVTFVRSENLPNIIKDYSDDHIFLLSRVGINEIVVNEDLLNNTSTYLEDYIVPDNYMENIFSCAMLEKLIYECENLLQELLIRLVRNFMDIPPEFTQLSFTLFVDRIIDEMRERGITYIGTTMCEYNLGLKYSPAMIRLHTLNNTFIRSITKHIFTLANSIDTDLHFDKYTNTIKTQCDKNDDDVTFVGGHIVTDMLNEKIKILLGYMTIAKSEELKLDDTKKLALTPYHDIWIGTRNFVDELYKVESSNYEIQKQNKLLSKPQENMSDLSSSDTQNENNADSDNENKLDDNQIVDDDNTITLDTNNTNDVDNSEDKSSVEDVANSDADKSNKNKDIERKFNYLNMMANNAKSKYSLRRITKINKIDKE